MRAMTAVLLALASLSAGGTSAAVPIVANTWAFTNATEASWRALHTHAGPGLAVLKAVEQVLLLYAGCDNSPHRTEIMQVKQLAIA
jgi:hypothetical protein